MAKCYSKNLTRVQILIRDSFLYLLKKQSFYKIHVKDIITGAGVSRAAFYSHYENKYELLESIQVEFLDGLKENFHAVRTSSQGKTLTLELPDATRIYSSYFNYIEENAEIFKLLLGQNGDGLFLEKLTTLIIEEQSKTRKDWDIEKVFPKPYISYLTILLSYGYAGVFIKWINSRNDEKFSSLEMGQFLADFFTLFKK